MHTVFLMLFCASLLFSQSFNKIDSIVHSMKDANPKDMRQNTVLLTELFSMPDSIQARKICERILDTLSLNNDKNLYIRVFLNFSALFPFQKRVELLDDGLRMAIEYDDENLAGIAYMMKGYAFKEYEVTDSAMYYSLRAKEIFEENGNFYDLVHVLLTIADLHYYARQYEKAEALYNEMIELKGDPKSWYGWQYNVVLNDLGLIRIKQKKFTEAEEYFLKSLDFINSRTLTTTDSLRLPYMYSMLMEINIHKKDFDIAKNYYKMGIPLALNYNLAMETATLYCGKGDICYSENKPDSALIFFQLAENYNNRSPRVENSINIYAGLTNTYKALNNIPAALSSIKLLRGSEHQADSLFNRAKYMNLYAEYNYENFINEIEDYRTNQLALLIFLGSIILSLAAISFFYYRSNQAYKKLVKKNLELAVQYAKSISKRTIENLAENNLPLLNGKKEYKLDDVTYNQLLLSLEELMKNEKLYLIPDISLDEIAKRLETNRAYISRIINEEYKSNFNNYINTFRIKEAVKMISDGEDKIYSVEGMAQKVGFANRISFNKAFRKYTGVAPSFFIKNSKEYTAVNY